MTDLSNFRYSIPISIRFADTDGMGHVNNAKYFTYMEAARIGYIRDVIRLDHAARTPGTILAHICCDFRLPLMFGDEARVYIRMTRLGTSSLGVAYVIQRVADGAIAAEGESVQVVYDYQTESSQPIPEAWRARILDFEPGLPT